MALKIRLLQDTASSPKHLSIFECELIFVSKPCSMRGWYNPHFTHRELKPEVIKVKSFHYFFVLPRTWFLSLFNTLFSVSKAQYVLPQLLLWELSTPSRQKWNLHPHMHNTRSTQSLITSDKVGFKNLPSTTQKFCGKEEDKHTFPGQHVTAFTTCCACSWCNLSSACSFRTRQQVRWRSWTCEGCCFLSASYPWFLRTNVLGEGNRHSSVPHLLTLVFFSLRKNNKNVGQRWWTHPSGVEMAKLNELDHQTTLKHRLCSGAHNVYALLHIFPFSFLTPPCSCCTCIFLSL